ncbi:T9SS type A sorting domain-containing protein [candidate division KSB1 bacterium]|nr:T9SS type A sorting domain-containing protein [candidate division KSB1 bacterium]
MKKLLVILICVLLGGATLFAQDTLTIAPLPAGEFLNEKIDDEYSNYDVFKLERGGVYYLNGAITTVGGLNLVGEVEPEATAPAVIQPGILGDGTIPDQTFNISGDFTLKHIYCMAVGPLGLQQQGNFCNIATDEVTVVIDQCVIEGNQEFGVRVLGKYPTISVTNTKFRNCQMLGNYYNGRALWTDQPSESILLENNTMLNCVAYFLVDRGSKSVKINHNTLVNILGTPNFMHQQYNCEFTNNVFYNSNFLGQSQTQIDGNWDDMDNEPAATFSVDTLSATVDSMWNADVPGGPYTESDRSVQVENNSYFYSQDFVDFWDSSADLHGGYFMNSRTEAMFADDTNYPLLIAEGNVNVEPNFAQKPDTEAEQLANCQAIREVPGAPSAVYWGYDGANNELGNLVWPLPEDLSYDNAALLTAGTDGLPLGDLNWFGLAVGVDSDDDLKMPKDFTLHQNYPNPFNPSTTIEYTLNTAGVTNLNVCNLLGQNIMTLVDHEHQNAGLYKKSIDMSGFTSGMYFVVLEQSDNRSIQKMMLLK